VKNNVYLREKEAEVCYIKSSFRKKPAEVAEQAPEDVCKHMVDRRQGLALAQAQKEKILF
jgi:hypothetical protein